MGEGTSPIFDRVPAGAQDAPKPGAGSGILALFVAEAERLLRQVENADDPQTGATAARHDRAGAAHGAMRLADVARALETEILPHGAGPSAAREALAETIAYINGGPV
jgi:hypothetical protein